MPEFGKKYSGPFQVFRGWAIFPILSNGAPIDVNISVTVTVCYHSKLSWPLLIVKFQEN